MSTDPHDIAEAAEQPGAATSGRSHADRIREARARKAQDGPPELAIALPDGNIVVVYERARLKTIRAAAASRGALGSNIELLIRACKRIEFRDPATGERVPAAKETDRPDVPVRFDGRLADLLELDASTPRDILTQTFEGNDRAIVHHAMRLDHWSSGEDQDLDAVEEVDDLLGEAPAAT